MVSIPFFGVGRYPFCTFIIPQGLEFVKTFFRFFWKSFLSLGSVLLSFPLPCICIIPQVERFVKRFFEDFQNFFLGLGLLPLPCTTIIHHRNPKVNRQNTQLWEKYFLIFCRIFLLTKLRRGGIIKIMPATSHRGPPASFVQNDEKRRAYALPLIGLFTGSCSHSQNTWHCRLSEFPWRLHSVLS